jgi:ABC-type lipoprotein release transport system permease subunit
MLFEVKPNDPAVTATVVVILMAITLAACALPAWRASRIDPAITLRTE